MNVQDTFMMIKPDAVERGSECVASILYRIEKDVGIIKRLIRQQVSVVCAFELYAEHKGRPFYDSLIDFTSDGECILMRVIGEDAIDKARTLVGATNPANADPNTLRRIWGTIGPRNAVHASDSLDSADRELRIMGM